MTQRKTILRSRELNCPSCVAKIERALREIDGVAGAKVHFASGRIEVEHDSQRVESTQLVDAIARVGYTAQVSPL
ncbi:MAG: heavy-metal-associated domain-containing protein [Burkholderiaceae bacterium]|nr:heavy-metal-associated domain-containing protein [Burkholderiaceae bacterium]